MPLQAGIRCEMSFPPKGGAIEEDRIIAWQNTAYYPQGSLLLSRVLLFSTPFLKIFFI